jgi:Zn-dependent peptidase ImmA (M78 family)
MNLTLYKPTDLENWITDRYLDHDIFRPTDLDLDLIASIFNIQIFRYEGPAFANWKDGEYSFVFLASEQTEIEQRETFFHEICHPLRHVGDQSKLPPPFIELQEAQAASFAMYAAMPYYMFRDYPKQPLRADYVRTLAEEFRVSIEFADRRLRQIETRIIQEEYHQTMFDRQYEPRPPRTYSAETVRIMDQLWRQVNSKRGAFEL